MLVQLTRATEDEFGAATGEAPISLNPEHVAVFFGGDGSQMETIARLSNGHGYKLFGSYAEVKDKLSEGNHFVELPRYSEAIDDEPGEGDAPAQEPAMISVNPPLVAAILHDRTHSGVTIIKLRDGRGFKIGMAYADVSAALSQPLN